MTYVDPSRNPLHDPESGLYHGEPPRDPSVGPILRPADDPDGFDDDASSAMGADYTPADAAGADEPDDAEPDEAYEEWTLESLRPLAKELGILGVSSLSKADLIAEIRQAEADAE